MGDVIDFAKPEDPKPPATVEPAKYVEMIILATADPDAEDVKWHPVLPENIPDWIKSDPDLIGMLRAGHMAHRRSDTLWYRGEPIQ